IFKDTTTGAKDDLTKATEIAQEMVCSYGMSSFGNVAVDEYYLRYNYEVVRKEVKKIIDKSYREAIKILEDNKIILLHISDVLMENESMTNEELDEILKLYELSSDSAT